MNKIAVIILCIVTLLTAAVGTTLAYLTDSESSGEMVFVSGSVRVELEIKNDPSKSSSLIPSQPIPQIVTVTNTGTSDAYVRVRVRVPSAINVNISKDTSSNPTYTLVKTNDIYDASGSVKEYVEYTLVYNTVLKPGSSTENAAEHIIVSAETSSNASENTKQFHFHVDAIQASTFTDVTAAFAAFDAQNSTNNSTNP